MSNYVSIALEFERLLNHLFVKRSKVARKFEENGEFHCPIIYHNYRGHLLMTLRKSKQINPSLKLLNGKKFIKLYNLYYDHHSPLFFYFPIFNYYSLENKKAQKM